MAPESDASDRMIKAALALASERGWRNVSLADMVARAELPLLEAYQEFSSKTAVLLRLVGSTDRAALSQGPAAASDTPRDRLFDVLMRRFDALQSRREGTIAILRDLPSDPASLLCLAPRVARSMAWMLEAAGISSSGCAGSLRVKGLALIYLDALRVWMKDESPDMARTMAALDKGLRRAERIARSLPLAPRHRATEGTAPGEPPPGSPPAPEGPPPLAV
jgi:AcrR family transcriptional regulator